MANGLAQYDRMVVPGHKALAQWSDYDGSFGYYCTCGLACYDYASYEYALAAKRRHLRAASKKAGK